MTMLPETVTVGIVVRRFIDILQFYDIFITVFPLISKELTLVS